MRLIFLYSSRGARNHTKWDPSLEAKSSIAIQYSSDGYPYVADRLIENNVIDEVLTFVEVGRLHGHIKISDKHTVYAIPNIKCIYEYIKPNDVIFVRGCWKHWAEPLSKLCKKHWMIYYGAGTPRSNWAYWHVVMHDFIDKPIKGKRHPRVPFIKPIHPKVFYPIKNTEKEYDVLLNSCFHIYDKKGQYKFINAAVEYQKLFSKNLKIALPGGSYRNTYTSKMPDVIKNNNLDVYRPGTLSRQDLNILINKCKIYVHIGFCEQNARSALEAMKCNLPLYIANPKLWPTHVCNNRNIVNICKNANDYTQIAKDIHKMLVDIDSGLYQGASKYFDNTNSPEFTVKQFTQLLEIMKKYDIPDQNLLIGELVI